MKAPKRKIKLSRRTTKRLKWGVAGCGHYLETGFLPSLQLLNRSKLVSVYSSNRGRSRSIAGKFGAEYSFSDYAEFLQSGIDVVYVSSRNSDHYWQIMEAAKAGKNILCEKPLALNYAQAEQMVNECKKNNVELGINYVFRFNPLIYKAKELVTNAVIGKVISVSTNFNINYPPDNNYRFQKEHGGGALFDLGTHMIDLLRYFGGEISETRGYTDKVVYNSEVDDFSAGILKFEKGGYGTFNVSFNSKIPVNKIEIIGLNGIINIDNRPGRKRGTTKLTIEISGEAKKTFRKKSNMQLNLLRDFQKSILADKHVHVSGYDGMINMKLMESLLKK
jgi:predicted dehydrogenase